LFLQVDPLALTAQPAYAIDNGPMTDLGPTITIPASWLAEPNALAVGTIGTAGTTGTNFTATWVEIGIHPTTLAGTGSWVTLPSSVPNVRHEDAYIEHNGLFYLFGGRGAGTVNIYNPVTDSWSVGAPPPIEMHHMQPVVYDGLIYVLGAMTGPYPNEAPVSHVYIYDPFNDNWYQGMEIPVARRRGGGALAVYNDKIYFAGGIQNGHISGTVGWLDEFDPRTNSWTALPDDMPNARDHVHGVVYGDKLYVVGGRVTTQPNFAAGTVPQVDVYDFILGNWTTLPNNLPTPRAAASLAVLGDELLVIGGESDVQSEAHSEVEALNLVDGSWRALASLPAGEDRHGTQAVVYGGYAYLAAGSGAQGGSPELSSQVRFGFGTCPIPTGGTSDTLITSVSSLAFGNVVNGLTATLNVTVTNPPSNSASILLSEAVLAGMDTAAFSVTPFLPVNLAPGASQVIEVTFAPDAERDFGAATVAADGAAVLALLHSGANSALVLPLSGTGASSGGNDPISGLALSTNSPVILGNVSAFNATITAGTNVTYTWNFGDGTVTVGPAATTHTYAALGSYSVVVTATNPINSQVAGATMQIIDPPPFAQYINANGTAVFNGSGGKVWEVDNSFSGGLTYSNTGLAIAGTTDDLLYQTERYGNFSYNIALDDGCYDVILHFAEIWWGVGAAGGPGSRVFDVTIEGVLELDNYDIYAAVGPSTPDVHAFEIQVTDGSLDIDFFTEVNNAKVSAIEVLYNRALCSVPTAINLDDVNQAPNGSLWGGVALVVVLVFVLGYVYVKRRGQMV
ncbi:MAG: PKD domain-containing protein, partial [Anaerolineales bacterium]|nr:PKD domain-containing protein [Anaerolineales bacterium]